MEKYGRETVLRRISLTVRSWEVCPKSQTYLNSKAPC